MYLFSSVQAQGNEMVVVLKTIITKHSTSYRDSIQQIIQQTFSGYFMDILQGWSMVDLLIISKDGKWRGGVGE